MNRKSNWKNVDKKIDLIFKEENKRPNSATVKKTNPSHSLPYISPTVTNDIYI